MIMLECIKNGMRKFSKIFFLVILTLLLPYYICNGEDRTLDDKARASAPGQFVRLHDGYTHYELGGPEQGQTVVLISGFSLPYGIWDRTFTSLTQAGFRVLRYDSFGRGYSDRPHDKYNPELFDRQLIELLDALKLQRPDIVSLSMGSVIGLNFANKRPDRIRKLVFVSPYGFPQEYPPTAKLMRIPYLGDYLMAVTGDYILTAMNNELNMPGQQRLKAQFYRQMRYKGFHHAMVSTLREFLMKDYSEMYKTYGRRNNPTLIVAGKNDNVVPIESIRLARQAIRHARYYEVENAGHSPLLENSELFNTILIDYLREK